MKNIKRKSTKISFPIPAVQLRIIKEFARRNNMDYKTLAEQWIAERLNEENHI